MCPIVYISVVSNYTVQIPIYNLWIGIGLIAGFWGFDLYTKNENKHYIDHVFYYLAASILIGFILSNRVDEILLTRKISSAFDFSRFTGITVMPGLMFGVITLLALLKINNYPLLYTLNLICPFVCLAHGFGRIGCFFAGCCFGTPTALPIGILFPSDSPASLKLGPNTPVHPTQIYSSIFLFILFFILIIYIRVNYRLCFYLYAYGIFRFFIEYLRGDYRGEFSGLDYFSPAQIFSVVFVIIAIILYLKTKQPFQSNLKETQCLAQGHPEQR
ncbi:MAG: prolipoprotein diacylglyceryl transferase [Thermodesulfobacteriota bacterium]|nr:prolipoprotein diacylglyceryl transferase [Thermodesulfobacteriota bacterium]